MWTLQFWRRSDTAATDARTRRLLARIAAQQTEIAQRQAFADVLIAVLRAAVQLQAPEEGRRER